MRWGNSSLYIYCWGRFLIVQCALLWAYYFVNIQSLVQFCSLFVVATQRFVARRKFCGTVVSFHVCLRGISYNPIPSPFSFPIAFICKRRDDVPQSLSIFVEIVTSDLYGDGGEENASPFIPYAQRWLKLRVNCSMLRDKRQSQLLYCYCNTLRTWIFWTRMLCKEGVRWDSRLSLRNWR